MAADRGPQTPEDPCPKRGAGLKHTLDYPRFGHRCVECGVGLVPYEGPRQYSYDRPDWPPPEQRPTFDIAGRFRMLGLGPPAKEPSDELAPLADRETGIEGKWITGSGPDGHGDGRGRASVLGQHRARLERLRASWLRGDRD